MLLARRAELISRSRSITSLHPEGQRIRIHGDYHLGQTLRTGDDSTGDFMMLDFEGEPARSLDERRSKQSPLKDVAGMIRSFSYAAYAGMHRLVEAAPEDARDSEMSRLGAWARLWQNAASAEFLLAYRETIGKSKTLLPSAHVAQALLDAYLLEKALYELMYELNHRPAWLRIPIAGILSLLKQSQNGAGSSR
jgi:maltose alpha-D-glucosyltransferase/alpha-amylase